MKLHDEYLHNLYLFPDVIRIVRGKDVNCWIIWHNVTLDVHRELLENLNCNEQSAPHLGAHL